MRRAIQKKAKFDIMDLNTIKVANSCFVPVLLGHAIDDDFIRPHHSDRIFEAYMGDKNIIKFEGDHNSLRPQFYFDSINIFFHNVLQPPADEVARAFSDHMDDYFGKGGWRNDLEVANDHGTSATSKGPAESSTADAITKLRTRRPMSRTEVPSKDDQSEDENEKIDDDRCPSSSEMISFEFSNGHPYGPHVPTTSDDDQYVEYQLDDLTGFPSNSEEEERMFMEAVIESLKELERRHPQAGEPPGVSSSSIMPSPKDGLEASPMDDCGPSKTQLIPTSVKQCEPSKTEPTSTSVISVQKLASGHPSPDISVSGMEIGSTGTSVHCDTSASIQSSSDTDMSANTKATLTVERNPPSHVMDGLMRRWDFNFFRSHNR